MTRNERAARRAQSERLEKVSAAVQDERNRFNLALNSGKVAILSTAFGPYRVDAVTSDHWYICGSGLHQRSFCGCNDGKWSELLQQAGVPRNPLFI